MSSKCNIYENHLIGKVDEQDGEEKISEIYRVLWRDDKKLIWINVHDNSFPVEIDVKYLKDKIASGYYCFVKVDPWFKEVNLNVDVDVEVDTVKVAEKKNKIKKIRDSRYELIQPFINKEPSIYTEEGRASAYKKSGCSPKQMIQYLKAYWKRGKTIDALLPDFNLCGVEKNTDPNKKRVKRGPKYKNKKITGMSLVDQDYKIFDTYIKKHITLKGKGITATYGLMKEREYKYKEVLDEKDKIVRIKNSEDDIPSIDQFKKYYYKIKSAEKREKDKLGKKSYKMNRRAKVGSIKSRGPGYNFVIDATVIDYYIRSHYPPYNLIGQPVFYIIIDVYTRFIIGWHMGVGNPSGESAIMALVSMASDKRKLLEQLGFNDDDHIEELCMIYGTPKVLTIDQAELRKNLTINLTKNLGVTISEVTSKRPDWKGIVETRFKILQSWEEMYDPSRGNYNKKKYGDPDMRLKAIKTFDEIYLEFIELILMHNQLSISNPFILDNLAVMEDISPRPYELFKHGVESVSGYVRAYPEDVVKLNLLPRDKATITDRGIKFKGLFYTPLMNNWEQFLVSSKPRKQSKRNPENEIEICLDKRNIDSIYIPAIDGMSYVKCVLQERCLRTVQPFLEEGIADKQRNSISNLTWFEWEDFLDVYASNNESDKDIDNEIREKYDRRFTDRAEKAKKKTEELTKNLSNRAFISGAKERKQQLAEEQSQANTIKLHVPGNSIITYDTEDDDEDYEIDYSQHISAQMKKHSNPEEDDDE